MSETNPPPSRDRSPQGRRVLVAVVTGDAGVRIQAWRERYDPEQALRLPPHVTLCYWAPVADPALIERQVRHAFDRPVAVRLGGVQRFENDEGTFYAAVLETAALDRARERLYDGAHLQLPGRRTWSWHVTCVRDARGRDVAALWSAARDLRLDVLWPVETVAYLELRDDRYEPVATWSTRQ